MTILKKYKANKKIIGYITEYKGNFKFCTGKPSDRSCLSWNYTKFDDAKKTGDEYFSNYTNI